MAEWFKPPGAIGVKRVNEDMHENAKSPEYYPLPEGHLSAFENTAGKPPEQH